MEKEQFRIKMLEWVASFEAECKMIDNLHKKKGVYPSHNRAFEKLVNKIYTYTTKTKKLINKE